MKREGLLNPAICAEVAALGHTELLCIADSGLPVPKETKVIDVSVTAGIPSFVDVLGAVSSELVIESAIVASEVARANPAVNNAIRDRLSGVPIQEITHTEFKKLLVHAKCVVRTGETTPYANVLLIGGVTF